ncbi:12368_t:CDS:2 [Funneliformis geosporum]|uniref:12368_t:CDS:1 n=1 Tax=Funneliformis geosporum TaxID=1117311 RepID=A0A9W4SVU2_9GLOM|nr:12368_t:CDS:2 [Funneliformis geosporum]
MYDDMKYLLVCPPAEQAIYERALELCIQHRFRKATLSEYPVFITYHNLANGDEKKMRVVVNKIVRADMSSESAYWEHHMKYEDLFKQNAMLGSFSIYDFYRIATGSSTRRATSLEINEYYIYVTMSNSKMRTTTSGYNHIVCLVTDDHTRKFLKNML